MSFFPELLIDILDRQLPAQAGRGVVVAFSGGLDSTVLLHSMVEVARVRSRFQVRAIHVDHRLQAASARWGEQCLAAAAKLGVECQVHSVEVRVDPSLGVEASARAARYDALRRALQPGETLLTAHHADDQLETMLLALLRGAGVRGLAAMPGCQVFGSGWHARPLLTHTRHSLEEWARAQQLRWICDPTNSQERFDRNYLRAQVLPVLRSRWPAVAQNAVRAAAHQGEADVLLQALAAADLQATGAGECLRVDALVALDPPRRRNLLRHWLRLRGARAPSARKLAGLEYDMLHAQSDRVPCVAWEGVEVHRHRQLLYCVTHLESATEVGSGSRAWHWLEPLRLPGLGELRLERAHGVGLCVARLPPQVQVRFREGRERLQLPGRDHHHQLKKLLQAASILPWYRDRLPLLYVGRQLAAVADLWVDAAFAANADEPGLRVVWSDRPQLTARDNGTGTTAQGQPHRDDIVAPAPVTTPR